MRKLACLTLLLLTGLLTTLAPSHAATFTVTSLADDGGPGELRWAINSANGTPGSNINFQTGLTGTITLTSSLPQIFTGTAVQGPGASLVTIDGNGSYQAFCINAQGSIVLISGLTIQHGNDNNGNGPGGAICIERGNSTIDHCVFSNCSDIFYGGGAINNDDTATITSCSFVNNSSGAPANGWPGGGAIYNQQPATISLTNCTFTLNSAPTSNGGGLSNSGTATITNCVFSGNQSPFGGGIATSSPNAVQVTNSTFVGNTSTTSGNGIIIAQTSPLSTITNCIVFDGGSNPANDFVSQNATSVSYSDIQGGYTGTGNINLDPSFANAPSDLHLTVNSPCFGTGTLTLAPKTTIDNGSRPNPPSMGAYELATTNSDPIPTITYFTPGSGSTGTVVNIVGTNFTGTLQVEFNGLPAAFTVVGAKSINATAPSGNIAGPISVTTASGTAVSTVAFNSAVAPSITSLNPSVATVGHFVSIFGKNLTGATSVSFNGVSTYFDTYSSTEIDVETPEGAITGPISVTTPQGTAYSMPVSVVPPAVITSFSPTSGAVGTTVTISGSGLTGASEVIFNQTSASATVINDSTITAIVPSGAITGRIWVYGADSEAESSTNFTVPGTPYISSFTPDYGLAGSTIVITGTNFNGATAVKFNQTPAATYSVVNSTTINAVVPAGLSSYQYLYVATPNGTAESSSAYYPTVQPTITSIAPNAGPVGSSVGINGSGLQSVSGISFNGTPATTYTSYYDDYIAVTVPAGATSGPIKVTNAVGSTTSGSNFTVTYASPSITSFTPNAGPTGTTITITGTNLSGATAVKFNGTSSSSFNVVSATSVTATAPAGATTGAITVTTPGGTATSSTNFTVSSAVPTITSFTPSSGSVGTSVTITGTNFTGATSVKFNGTTSIYNVVSAASITATVPSGATTGAITVTTVGGTTTSSTNFTIGATPTISSFTPVSGSVGTFVTITGTNFTGATAVKFNGTSASTFNVVSSTSITATVPTGATSNTISVTTPGGTATSSTIFTVTIPAPTISSFTPGSGPIGTVITITGTNLTGTTSVSFNGTAASTYSVVGPTSITATVPTGATSGTLSVTTPGGIATSSVTYTVTTASPTITSISPTSGPIATVVTITGANLTGATAVKFNGTAATTYTVANSTTINATVPTGATTGTISLTTPGGSATSSASFTVLAAPVTPTLTATAGNGQVYLSWTASPGATSYNLFRSILPNDTSVASFANVTSGTTYKNAGNTNGTTYYYKVMAVGTTGKSARSADAAVTPSASAPTIASFSPTSGAVGSYVVVTGQNFTGVNSVRLGSLTASYTLNSATQITLTIPVGAASGLITVGNASGIAQSATNFTLTP